jgi:hypothetical protein
MKNAISKKKAKSILVKEKKRLKIIPDLNEKISPKLRSLVTGITYENYEEEQDILRVLDPILAANKELERASLNAVLVLEEILMGYGKAENRLAAAREILSKKIPTIKITDLKTDKPLSIEFISNMPSKEE